MPSNPKLANTHCPRCTKLLDEATVIGEPHAEPEPGHYTVCIHCAVIARFNNDLTLRIPTERDAIELMSQPDELLKATVAQMAIRKLLRMQAVSN